MAEIRTARCMSCGGRVYCMEGFSTRPGTPQWLHEDRRDWLSGGAHTPLLPQPAVDDKGNPTA